MPVTVHPLLLWILGGVIAALTTGSVARITALRGKPRELVQQRVGSLKTWWILTVLLAASVLLGQLAAAGVFVIAGVLALREYAHLNQTDVTDRGGVLLASALIPVSYGLICLGKVEAFQIFLPLGTLFVLSARRTIAGRTDGFIRSTARLHWGLLLLAYAPAHAVLLLSIPASDSAEIGPVGWFLYLLILTEMNDIAQAFFGRHFGVRKIVPRVSPHKTWTGFLGGVFVTMALAMLLSPVLTPWKLMLAAPSLRGWICPICAGLLISVCGFLGDINMSAIKRDIGVKDGSSLLPGQGGVIDRIDSLTFTAPAFYYFVVWTVIA